MISKSKYLPISNDDILVSLYQRRFELGRASGAPDSNLTGNLVALPVLESNGVPFEFFNGMKDPENEYMLHFDGCSKGNPGFSGAGAVLYENGREIYAGCAFVGENETNNVAEYTGLIIGLKKAREMGIPRLEVKGDSLLVIKQMKGEYKVKSPGLFALYQQAKSLEIHFEWVGYTHVLRDQNKRADALSNEGLNAI